MTTTTAALTAAQLLQSLMTRLEASEFVSFEDHEDTDCHPGTAWVGVEAGDFSVVVNLWADPGRVIVVTNGDQTMYAQPTTGDWDARLVAFLESLAQAAAHAWPTWPPKAGGHLAAVPA